MRRTLVALLLLACMTPRAHALTADEHRRIALDAFVEAQRALFSDVPKTVSSESLAEITVRTSADDRARSRYPVRGLTPWEQVRSFGWDRINRIVDEVTEHPPTDHAFAPYGDDAVVNYMTYHMIAIRCAEKARDQHDWMDHALVYEAVAIGYLSDSFSSSHLLTPIHLPLARLQGANIRAAHEFFATQGAYVVNGRGEAWQTFGDGILVWYASAYQHVVGACIGSIGDVDLARRGRDSSSIVDRALSRIPMVVVATWNTGAAPGAGYRCRPQLREPGLHDPSLRVDQRFLYSSDGVPRTLIPEPLGNADPRELIRHNPLLESVEYHQTLDVPPAFAGLLLMAGGGSLVKDDGGGAVGSVAAGYGWEFRMPLLARLRTSLETEYVYRLGADDRRVVVPRYTVGIGSPLLPVAEAIHFEVGYAWGLEAPHKDQGVKWAVGIGTRTLRFPFTYAGVSLRAKYERFWLDETLDGFQLQFVFR